LPLIPCPIISCGGGANPWSHERLTSAVRKRTRMAFDFIEIGNLFW
jgi:hypothetical protein